MVDQVISKGERTRQAIEDAALALFMEQGYHATSMRQIAERAGLALGGIYNHFSGKEELFEGIIMDKHPYREVLPAVLAVEAESPEEFVRQAAHEMVHGLGKRPDVLKLMFIEIVEFNGRHISGLFGQILPQLLPLFEKYGRLRKGIRPIPAAVLLRSFLGLFFAFYITEQFIKGSIIKKLMPKNTFELFVDIYLYGILKPEESV
jgi:AcrR family transcriptional regulator